MTQRSICYCLSVCFIACLASCAAIRHTTPSAIGIVPLHLYTITDAASVTDTTYKVFTNEGDFKAAFTAASADARKPAFNGQTAVAVLLKDPSRMQFDKAETVGNTVHVYLSSCQPGTEAACRQSTLFLATIPKVGNAKRVAFILNGITKRTIGL